MEYSLLIIAHINNFFQVQADEPKVSPPLWSDSGGKYLLPFALIKSIGKLRLPN